MGFVMVYSACLICRQDFYYNPERVPSIRVDEAGKPSPTGSREPICETCMVRLNAARQAHGLTPFPVQPGAYEPEEV